MSRQRFSFEDFFEVTGGPLEGHEQRPRRLPAATETCQRLAHVATTDVMDKIDWELVSAGLLGHSINNTQHPPVNPDVS